MAKILLTHAPAARSNYYGDRALAGLQALGDVVLNTHERALDTNEVIEAARGCTCIVSDRQTLGDGRIFASLPDLVSFSRCAVDIRNVDVAAASASGVLVTRASAGFMASVSEWTIGAMIDLSRNLSASIIEYREGRIPVATMGRQLNGATLGVVGYGQIGRYLCDLGVALGMKVVVTTPGPDLPQPPLVRLGLDELLATSDFVVCLAVANEETENMFNAERFRKMKPTAYFINPSRGNLVDEPALEQALDQGLIAGCAMDVGRAPDQMPSPHLARHPKVIATPHSGGLTPSAVEHQSLETVAQVATILQGTIPVGAVNAERAARMERLRTRTQ